MHKKLKNILNNICRVLVSPLAFLCWIEKQVTNDSETIFSLMAETLSLVPGIPGAFIRRAFYSFTLIHCSMNCHIGFCTFFSHRNAMVEDNVYIGPFSIIGSAKIGKGSLLASRVSIPSGKNQHIKDKNGSWTPADHSRFVQIEIAHNVWIGEGAIVMANVGEGCLVAAGAVVTQDIKDKNIIVAGNPARFVDSLSR